MATKIQVRRGTGAAWTTSNTVLDIGEFGYNTTTNQLKIGDGTTAWADLDYLVSDAGLDTSLGDYIEILEKGAANGVAELDASLNILAPVGIVFEGSTSDTNQTTFVVTNPTADRTITLPDVSGTVITTGNLSDITNVGVFSGSITIEGSTANEYETTLSIVDPTADRTITFPDATGTVAIIDLAQTLTNKTIDGANNTITVRVANDISGLGTGVATFLATPSSANLASAITDETGSGALVFGTSPSITTSITTASTSFDLLNTTATTVNFAGAATAVSIGAVTSTVTINDDLVITGDLIVNGTTTTINSTTLTVDDKNIVLAQGNTSDAVADGGGITLEGATNKTFTWSDSTDAWTASEHMNLASGKSYKINNTAISAALPALTWGDVKNGKSGLVIS